MSETNDSSATNNTAENGKEKTVDNCTEFQNDEGFLMRFLYLGFNCNYYRPGNWFVHDYFKECNLHVIEELAADEEKQLKPVEIINKAFEQNLVPHTETLIFALALCARQDKSKTLRQEAYNAIKTICKHPQHFILFIKFASQMKPSHGWGHCWKKAVNNWYLSKDPLELAKCVTRYRGRYGWKHKDIIKLSHPQTSNAKMGAVLKYITHGYKVSRKDFENCEAAAEIFDYIKEVETFKHCEDDLAAASLIEINGLTLDHVPGHLLKSEEVWNALIPTLDLPTLLNNIQRIHNMGMLKPYAPAVSKIVDELVNVEKIANDKVHPALVLITVRNYENCGKPLSYEKRKLKEKAKKPAPSPLTPNPKIIEGLYKTLNLSFGHLQSTGLRYLITININKVMLENRAWHNANVTAAEASCLIALSILRREKHVTLATFRNVGIHTVNIDKNSSFAQAMRRLQDMPNSTVNVGKPMSWASHHNKKFDVFINLVDEIFEKNDSSKESIKNYRKTMNMPNAKLINCTLCSSYVHESTPFDVNTLTICGFDETVPTIIDAFSKSYF